MRVVARRVFILSAAAFTTVVACAQATVKHVQKGLRVARGEDRFGSGHDVLGGLHIDTKVSGEDTGGGLLMVEHSDRGAGGPPRHVHHSQEECFYVLEGAYVIEVGEERFTLGPGDCVLAPRGIPHAFAHTGQGPGRLLITFQPAGQMEAFFEKLAMAGPAPQPADLRALFGAHGMELLGAPLTP